MSCTMSTCPCSFKEVECRNNSDFFFFFLLKDTIVCTFRLVTALLEVIGCYIVPAVQSTLCILSCTCSFSHSQLNSKALKKVGFAVPLKDWFCCAP